MIELSQHFKRSEFACPCCGVDTVDAVTLFVLEKTRHNFGGLPITISEGGGCRCLDYNRSIGSDDTSQHVLYRAVDFTIKHVTPQEVQEYLLTTYDGYFGIGCYPTFTHFDSRDGGPARW